MAINQSDAYNTCIEFNPSWFAEASWIKSGPTPDKHLPISNLLLIKRNTKLNEKLDYQPSNRILRCIQLWSSLRCYVFLTNICPMHNLLCVVNRYDQIHTEKITIISSTYEAILYRKELGNLMKAADSSNMTW